MSQNQLESMLIFVYALIMQEKYEKASAVLAALEYLFPNNKHILRQYAVTLLRMECGEQAIVYTEKLLELEEDAKDVHMAKYLHASALWQMQRKEEARKFFMEGQ